MANNFSTATLGLGVDTKDFNKNFNETYKTTEKVLASMKLSADAFTDTWQNLTAGIKDTKRIVSGILVSRGFYALLQGFTTASSAALEFSKSMETAAISMEYFVKGADKAAKAQAFLREMNTFAARTPFSTQEAISLSKYMQAVGVSMNTTKNFLKVITDTAAATGATEENLQRIVFGLGQMMTKGRIANEEIRQLANANIPIYEILQEQLGITGEQISNIGRYWVDADKAIVAILTGLENRYGGAADRIADTVTGMTDTLIDNSKIIAQIAFAGGYDALAEKMGTIRDLLDEYREVATEQGSMGLFDKLLRDMDSSGELGTLILSLIGNTRQLGMALKDLYVAGKPIINLFGKSLYTSITIAEMTLTGMSKVVTGVIKGLEKFGLTSGNTAGAISSLYIAYKAAKWMAFLGQGAITAAYSMVQTVTSIGAVLPASIKASAGLKILTGSLIGLVTYGLAVYGIFKAINNTMAGLDAGTTGENLFPDDYSQALNEYQRKMDEYNEAIAKYQEDFNAPFDTIDDGTDKAVSDFEKIEDASEKSSKAVKKHWLAAFDEVYSPPKDTDAGSGLGGLLDDVADLGKLLIAPTFSFPETKGGIKLEMPDFPWADVYKGSAWDQDNDVFKADWWKQLLPWVALGAATQLGKIFAKARGEDPTGGVSAGNGGSLGGPTNPFQDPAAARAMLNKMTGEFGKIEQTLAETLAALKDGKYKTPDEITAGLKRLEMQVKAALSLQEKISLQSIIAGSSETLKSIKLLEAQQYLLKQSISDNADAFNKLAEAAKGLGYEGEKARADLSAMRRTLEKQYAEYITLGGGAADIDGIVDSIINTKGLGGKIDIVNNEVANIRKALMANNYDVLSLKDAIVSAAKTGKDVSKLLETVGASDTLLAENLILLENIDGILADQLKLTELTGELQTVEDILSTFTVQQSVDNKLNRSALNDRVESLNKRIEGIRDEIAVRRALVSAGTSGDIAAAKTAQELVNATNAFKQIAHTIETFATDAVAPLKAIERYNKRLILDNIEGQRIVKQGIAYANALIEKLPEDVQHIFQPSVNKLNEAYSEALKTGTKPSLTVLDYSSEFTEAVRQLGVSLKANNEAITTTVNKIDKHLLKLTGKYGVLEETVEKIKKAAEKRVEQASKPQIANNSAREVLQVYQDELEKFAERDTSVELFDKHVQHVEKVIRQIADAEQEKLYRKLLDEAKKTGAKPPALNDVPNAMRSFSEAYKDAYEQTKAELVARLEASRVQGSFLDTLDDLKVDAKHAFNLLRASAKDLATFRAGTDIGTGIRYGDAFPPESQAAPYAKGIEAKYFSKVIAESGIFDPYKAALKANEIAAMSGQSGYGKTVFSVIADHLTETGRLMSGVSKQLDTFRTVENKIVGQLAINPILKATNDILSGFDLVVATGGKFLDASRTIEASINGLVYTQNMQLTAPVNTLTMANFDSKLLPILEKYGTYADGIYALGTTGFNVLAESLDDVAGELAGQAAVMGKNTVYLSILDKKLALLDKLDFSDLAKYDLTNPKMLKLVQNEISARVATYMADHMKELAEAVRVVAVTVPQEAISKALTAGHDFKGAIDLVAASHRLGASLDKLLTPVTKLGDELGSLTAERFASNIYNAPLMGDAAANQLITEVVTDLKSTNKAISDAAASRITDFIERLNKAAYQKGVHPAELREVELGTTFNGRIARIAASGEKMIAKAAELQKLLSNIDSRASAITTSLHDLVAKYNTGASRGLYMDDLSGYTSAKGAPLTMRDLAHAIVNQEKQITTMGNLARQLSDSLGTASSNNLALPVTNYAQYADIGAYMTQLSQALPGQTALAITDFVTKAGTTPLLAADDTEHIVAQFKTLFELLKTHRIAGTDAAGRGFAASGRGFGNSFAFGSVTGQTPGQEAMNRYFMQFGGNFFKGGSGSGKIFSVGSETVSKSLGVLQSIGAVVKLGSDVIDEISTYKDYKALVASNDIEDPYGDPQTWLDKILSGISWADALSTRSGEWNTLRNYQEMSPEEQQFWGQKYISGSKWSSGFLGGGILGRGGWSTNLTDPFHTLSGEILLNPKDRQGEAYDTETDTAAFLRHIMTQEDNGKDVNLFRNIVDYLMTSGDTTSQTAIDFYKKYGAYVDEVLKPMYGMNNEWVAATDMLMSSNNKEIQALFETIAPNATSAIDIPVAVKPAVDNLLTQLQDGLETAILPTLLAQERHNSTTLSPLTGDYKRVVMGADFSGISDEAMDQLSNVLGITFEQIMGGGTIGIDSEKIADNIMGWVTRLPDTISLDGANLSAQDVAILASAGIQINGDGTVTFMKAMNENVTGTDRTIGLTIDDVSKKVLDALDESGLSFDFSAGETKLNLSLENVSEQMKTAMFRLNKDLAGQVSDDMDSVLEGLGRVLDSGYFEITNAAVLNGEMTIEEYLDSMGETIDTLSPELQAALRAIDDVILQGGEATRQTVAEWADGISMPSPIEASALTPEIEAAFAAIGITFTQSGEEFLMVVNRLGNHIQDGMVLIPAETWNKVNEDVIEALKKLGVKTSEEAGFVMVDISGAMESGVGSIIELFANRPDLWNQIPQQVIDQLAAAGIAVENGMISINTAALNGLVNLGTEWYGKWSTLPQDVITAMGAAGLQTESGLLKIEQLTENTAIPDNVNDYIIKPFDELPAELQDRLTGGDESVAATLKGSEVLITDATEDAFVGAVNAVAASFGEMNEEAEFGAAQLAETISQALASANSLNNIQIKKTWKPFETAAAKDTVKITGVPGNYTIRYGGITYSSIAAKTKAEAAKLVEQRSGLDLPGYFYGGLIDEEGLYRAGEFGKQEAIIPLENKAGLSVIGKAIGNTMRATTPVQAEQLRSARSLTNAGVVAQTANELARSYQTFYMQQQQRTQPMQQQDNKPIVYVNHMIADKQGLRELEQKLSIIRLER